MGFFDNIKALTGIPQTDKKTTAPARRVKILIVEDEPSLGDALALKLEHEGFEAIRAENGQVGLEKVGTMHPQLILLDLQMPVMDGKTMLHKIREIPEHKTLPVIVLTNAGTIDNMEQTRKFDNASEFLIKSNVSLDEIIIKIKQFIPHNY